MREMNENKKVYMDVHTHSRCSDGCMSKRDLIRKAIKENKGDRIVLAISDHNIPFTDCNELQEEFNDEIILIPACEVSCTYVTSEGKSKEIHINAVDYKMCGQEYIEFCEMLKKNQYDKRAYVEEILEKLEQIGIHVVDNYDELVDFVAPSKHMGRMAIARMMLKKGLVDSVDQAFDDYFGSYGKRTCYVENNFEYVSIEEAISTMLKTGAIPVLCHPYFYSFDKDELFRLISQFKAGGGLALESEYSAYTRIEKEELRAIAKQFGLICSAGSDYHGNEGEHLHHQFYCPELYEKLMEGRTMVK